MENKMIYTFRRILFLIIVNIPIASQLNADATKIWENASPSVVSIAPTWPGHENPGFGAPIGTAPEGTGIIVSENGHILTASHVISKAKKITIRISSGEEYDATVLYDDPATDLAIIKSKIKIKPITFAKK